MISDNFTSISSDAPITSYIFAFDNSISNLFVFSMLLGILIVMAFAIYTWQRDFIDSALFSSFMVTVMAFFLTLIIENGQSLLSFKKFLIFLFLTVLLALYKKVSEEG